MKVILTKDVRNMGPAGSAHDVADGHAINFLIPRKMAMPATAGTLAKAEMFKKQAEDRKAIDAGLLKQKIASLAEGRIVITHKANDKGHLYDAVNAADIAKATDLPVEVISLEKPIKEVGEFEIGISSGETFGSVMIVVEAEL
jgi:large subunit ribosomal protein L9